MIKKTASYFADLKWLTVAVSTLVLFGAALTSTAVKSQDLTAAELEDLIAPIALYPDDVLGVILPASTYPLDIVQAARFLEARENDPTLEPDADWDESIIALLNYPEVLFMMNDDLDWTWALGEAVLIDESAVLAAAQDFRQRALLAGNLPSDDRQIVSESNGVIEIQPADPEVVYIPVYEPREVIVYHPRPIYRYYPVAYPLYYYPYASGHFFTDVFWGVTSYFSIGWHTHHVHLYHHTHRLHPYYLNTHYLYTPYYYRRAPVVTVTVNNYADVWRPSARRGSGPRTITYEGRSSTVPSRTSTRTVESQPARTRTTGTAATTRRNQLANGSDANIGGVRTRTNTTGTTRSGNASTRRTQPVIGGRVERSNSGAATATPDTTRSVGSSAVSGSQLRGINRPSTTTTPRTRVPTTPSASSTRTNRVRTTPQTTAPSPSTRSSGSNLGGIRSASPRGPAAISVPRASAPVARSSAPSPRGPAATSVPRSSAPPARSSAPSTRSSSPPSRRNSR